MKEIEQLTEQKNKIEEAFVEASIPEDKMYEMGQLLESLIVQIEKNEERWLELSMKME